ncbi:MAG: hypothetical protein ABFD92_16670 [Planctomycetaceae bacterium]|nr:hypothetical protein [Planctomycetaceae bacterium]
MHSKTRFPLTARGIAVVVFLAAASVYAMIAPSGPCNLQAGQQSDPAYQRHQVEPTGEVVQPPLLDWQAELPISNFQFPIEQPSASPCQAPAADVRPSDVYDEAVDLIHAREGCCGKDPRCRPGFIGEDGEEGEMQYRPIWREDFRTLFGRDADPHAPVAQLRADVRAWLMVRGPQVGATTAAQLDDLYRLGPGGYRRAYGR